MNYIMCNTCLYNFQCEPKLQEHKKSKMCDQVIVDVPEKGAVLKFKDFTNQEPQPLVVYCDFQSMLVPVKETDKTQNTSKLHNHIPYAFGMLLECSFDKKLNEFYMYRAKTDDDTPADKQFVDQLIKKVMLFYEKNIIQPKYKPLNLSRYEREKLIEENDECSICKKFLYPPIAIDHCHLSGNLRGVAHQICNLNYQLVLREKK